MLASRKVVSETETNVQLYPASDVQKMFTILNLPVPDFILRAAQGEVCGHMTVACLSHVAYALHEHALVPQYKAMALCDWSNKTIRMAAAYIGVLEHILLPSVQQVLSHLTHISLYIIILQVAHNCHLIVCYIT